MFESKVKLLVIKDLLDAICLRIRKDSLTEMECDTIDNFVVDLVGMISELEDSDLDVILNHLGTLAKELKIKDKLLGKAAYTKKVALDRVCDISNHNPPQIILDNEFRIAKQKVETFILLKQVLK